MAKHKFRVGQRVQVITGHSDRNLPRGIYEIARQLPEDDGEFNYRIKSEHEPHLRVVKESQLRGYSDV
jgi:hypothetical protein